MLVRRTPSTICLARVAAALVLAAWVADPAGAPAREVNLTILHTTDLHGNVDNLLSGDPSSATGGLLRIASMIRDIRRDHPSALLLDAGDLIQGGPESYLSGGRIMLEALKALDYTAWTIGNHEFDWGVGKLAPLLAGSDIPCLAANISAADGAANPLPRLKPFVVREVDGVRIAIVGLTTPGVPSWVRGAKLAPLRFEDSRAALSRVLPRVRAENPDLIVLLAHQGLGRPVDDHANQLQLITRQFPDFDIIIGAHTHQDIEDRRFGATLYTQAGSHGRFLGRVDVAYDTDRRAIASMKARLLPVLPGQPADAALASTLAPFLKSARGQLGRRVGELAAPLDATRSPALLREAIRDATGADAVLHGALSDVSLPAGPVFERDIWRLVPYENDIGVLRLTPARLTDILDENAGLHGTYYVMNATGLRVRVTPSKPAGQRVRLLADAGGRPLEPDRTMSVAFNSYVLASGGLRFPRLREIAENPSSGLKISDMETRDVLRAYFKKAGRVNPGTLPENGITVQRADARRATKEDDR